MIGKYHQKAKIVSQSERNGKLIFDFLTVLFTLVYTHTRTIRKETFMYKPNKESVESVY